MRMRVLKSSIKITHNHYLVPNRGSSEDGLKLVPHFAAKGAVFGRTVVRSPHMLVDSQDARRHLTANVCCSNLKQASWGMFFDPWLREATAGQHTQDAGIPIWLSLLGVARTMDAEPLPASIILNLLPVCLGEDYDIILLRDLPGFDPSHELLHKS